MSLDVFRGATIAAMILVNNPGSWNHVYPPLLHAEWHGWTFTDLIFPFFLWIVGVAMPLSISRRLEQGQSRRTLLLHAVRRAAILFGLGLFLASFSYLIDGSMFRDGFLAWVQNYATHVRIPGVLQRIAVCYLIASFILLNCRLRAQVMWTGALLALYWLLMTLVPVPGYGAGVLEKEGNLSQFIDNLVLNGPVIGTHVYKVAKTWDPEGILSTIPAVATCLLGIMAGHILRSKSNPETRTSWLFVMGSLLVLEGAILNCWFPINKNLWTSSYSVFMAGMASICFAVCYWLVDVQGWKKWARPFAIYGMNAITVFVLAGVLGRLSIEIQIPAQSGKVALKTWLYSNLFQPFASPDTAPFFGFLASPRNASLLWAVSYVLLLYGVAYVMYRRKWFVKF
jgi:predicted acyltransferase